MAKHFVKQVSRGEKIKPHVTAQTWNSFADAANRIHTEPAKDGKHQVTANTQFIGPFVRLDADRPRGNAVGFNDTAFQNTDNEAKFLTAPVLDMVETADKPGRWGISTGGRDGGATRLAMAGVITANLNVPANGDWIDRCEIDPTDTSRLVSHPGGSAQILEKSGSSGDVKAVIRFGTPQNVTYRATTTSEITSGSSGSVDLWGSPGSASGFTVLAHLGWMTSSGNPVESGAEVLVMWFPTEERWHIIGAQCPTT
jgi:hypothetical protein